jgi:hypothetical protein
VAPTAAAHAGSTPTPSIGDWASTPIRSPVGGAIVSALAKDVARAGGDHHAAGSWRASTSRAAAVSATDRVSTPFVAKPSRSTIPLVTRPRVGLSPTRPLHDEGMRIDPPPSLPWAMGAIPAATAAPAPLDDPPGVRSGSQGLRVMPRASLSVKGTVPNSGVVVLPSSTNPASTNRCTTGSEAPAGSGLAPADPKVVGQPATSLRSLIGSGTPWNGGRSSVEAAATTASAAADAALRTSSSARWQNALSRGSSSSIRSR